jgi:hypothetical protein
MRVYKYRGGDKKILKRDLSSLAKSQMFSAPIETLNDPFEAVVNLNEGSFEIGNLLQIIPRFKYDEKFKEVEKGFLKILLDFMNTSKSWGIYSLSKTYRDELLWAYYADAHRGFCVEYELDELKEYSIRTEPSFDVKYQNKMPELSSFDMLSIKEHPEILQEKLIATKSTKWKHEDEIRIVTGTSGLFDYDYRALKAVYFGHRSDEKFQKLTMRVLKGRSIKYYVMKPKNGAYELEKHELDDYYLNAAKYLNSIAPIEDGVPYFDERTKPFEELINSAIEIVRREPYCEKITDAYISGSKGTKDNPVFYVSYERSDGMHRNHYLSKSEITSYKAN